MMVAGAAMILGLVGATALDRQALLQRGVRAEAVVLRIDSTGGRRAGFYPVYAFTTAQGAAVEAISRVSVPRDRLQVSDRVTVVHDATDPGHVRDAAGFDAETSLAHWLWAGFALVLVAVAVMVVRGPRRAPA